MAVKQIMTTGVTGRADAPTSAVAARSSTGSAACPFAREGVEAVRLTALRSGQRTSHGLVFTQLTFVKIVHPLLRHVHVGAGRAGSKGVRGYEHRGSDRADQLGGSSSVW